MTGAATGWRLRHRLNVAFACAGTLLVLFGVAGILTFDQLDDSMRAQADRISPARVAAADLMAALVDQETGVRGYALTGRDEYLDPYRRGREQQAAADAELRRLLRDRPDVLADVDAVRDRVERWRTEVAEPAVGTVRRGGPSAASAAQVAAGRTAFDRIRTASATVDADLTAARDAIRADMGRSLTLLLLLAAGTGLAAVLAGMVLAVALRRWVTRPLEHLGAEVRQVVGGDLAHPVAVGGPPDITLLARDVESMRQRIGAELAEAVRAREQLQESAEDLRRSNAELEQFAYVASHDLQEPLRKVASFCQMLQRRYSGQLDARADQYIEFAVDGAKRMQRLINDLLAFSRVGRTTESFVPVDCTEAFEAATASLEVARSEADAELTADPLPVVSGDLSLITQLFQNLLSNSIKFRGTEPPRAHLSVTREDDEWLFCCRDNGIGIEPVYADRVFVIFQRLHSKDAYSGTGIGLALCKKIVEYHGGRIWLDTTYEKGTALWFTLPVPVAAPAGAAAPAGTADGD